MTKKSGAEGGLAAIGAQYLEADGVEIRAKESTRLVASRGAQQSEKRLLGEFLCVGGFGEAAAKKPVDGLLVPGEEFRKRLRRTLRKSQHEPARLEDSVGCWRFVHGV